VLVEEGGNDLANNLAAAPPRVVGLWIAPCNDVPAGAGVDDADQAPGQPVQLGGGRGGGVGGRRGDGSRVGRWHNRLAARYGISARYGVVARNPVGTAAVTGNIAPPPASSTVTSPPSAFTRSVPATTAVGLATRPW